MGRRKKKSSMFRPAGTWAAGPSPTVGEDACAESDIYIAGVLVSSLRAEFLRSGVGRSINCRPLREMKDRSG